MTDDAKKSTGGGSATNAGVEYQAAAAAWIASQILAGSSAPMRFGLNTQDVYERLLVESDNAVDDLVVKTKLDNTVYIQAKRNLNKSDSPTSDFGKTLKQFQLQFDKLESNGDVLDRCRFVMLVGDTTPATVHTQMREMLNRLRAGADVSSLNKASTESYTTIRNHLDRLWSKDTDADVRKAKIARLLKLTYIEHALLLDEASQQHESQLILRTAVLADPSQSVTAWNVLCQESIKLGRLKGGLEYGKAINLLIHASLDLKSNPAYDNDIAALKELTQRSIAAISRSKLITVGGQPRTIERSAHDELFQLAAEGHSFVVVGEPGAGKSAALHDLSVKLIQDGHPVILIPTDRVQASGEGALLSELRVNHGLTEVLNNWRSSDKQAVLIVDALDAAREHNAMQMFIDIMQRVADEVPLWSIVLSIRKYDLRNTIRLNSIFKSEVLTKQHDHNFSIANFDVPLLTSSEIRQITSHSEQLNELFEKLPVPAKDLLRTPFNLSLAAEIADSGGSSALHYDVDTQQGLLDSYWKTRVEDNSDSLSDARKSLLHSITGQMVAERTMWVERDRLVSVGETTTSALDSLLSRGVLIEDPSNLRISFGHHVLYDFAIFRSFLSRQSPVQLSDLIEQTPYILLSIRPSINMRLKALWELEISHRSFWHFGMLLESRTTAQRLFKLLIAESAVAWSRSKIDILELENVINDVPSSRTEGALSLFRRCSHVMSARFQRKQEPNAAPWISCTYAAVRESKLTEIQHSALSIVDLAVAKLSNLTQEDQNLCGGIARSVLSTLLSDNAPNEWMSRTAIALVVKTYQTDPDASFGLLRKLIAADRVAVYGYVELRHLAYVIADLTKINPEFVLSVYNVAFSYKEESTDTTSMIPSQILGINSTKKQDYGMVLSTLGGALKEILKEDLSLSLKLLYLILSKTRRSRDWATNDPRRSGLISFGGSAGVLVEDGSGYWDDNGILPQDAEPALKVFRAYIQFEANTQADIASRLASALAENLDYLHDAIFWRTILRSVNEHVDVFGTELAEFFTQLPFLVMIDTKREAARFLKAVEPNLSLEQRQFVELQIIRMTDFREFSYRDGYLERVQLEYVALLPEESVQDARIEVLRNEMGSDDVGDITSSLSGTFASRGGESDESPDTLMWNELRRRTQDIVQGLSERSTELDIQSAISLVDELNDKSRSDEKRTEEAPDLKLQILEKLTSLDQIALTSARWVNIRTRVIELCDTPNPIASVEIDEEYEQNEFFSTRITRAEAAQLLTYIAYRESDMTPDAVTREIISRLSHDPSAIVRAFVARNLYLLMNADFYRDMAWSLYETLSRDPHQRVRESVVLSVRSNSTADAHRSVTILRTVDSTIDDSTIVSLRQHISLVAALMFVDTGNSEARKLIDRVLEEPARHTEEVWKLSVEFRSKLIEGIQSVDSLEGEQVRRRATEIFLSVAQNSATEVKAWQDARSFDPKKDPTPEESSLIQATMKNVSNIADNIYFASGAYESTKTDGVPTTDAEKRRFLKQCHTLLDTVAAIGSVNANHHLVDLAVAYLDINPRWAMRYMHLCMTSAAQNGVGYESFMADSIITFVLRMFSSHREQLRDAENQRMLLEMIDIFIDTGWPQAINLVSDLEQAY
jgi:hypothetical protein